ncbi:MAG: TolC family protein [Bacteroidales bacterium]
MKNKIIYLASIILLAASCKVGPNYVKPTIQTPGSFRFAEGTADSALNLKWWTLFNDDYLTALVDSALVHNQDVMIAASRIEEARAVVGFNKADMLPVIGYDGGASRYTSNFPGAGCSGPYNDFSGVATWHGSSIFGGSTGEPPRPPERSYWQHNIIKGLFS